eukprot:Lankesteria_metandrocarpae@DN5404_c0_g1_i2.p1
MAGKHSLVYFPIRQGRALVVELCLQYGDIDYDFETMAFDKWPATKADANQAPFGCLPVLKLPNGQLLSQAMAISYYLAQKCNLMYNDTMMDSRVFELVHAIQDVLPIFVKSIGLDEESRKKMREEMFKTTIPAHLARIDDSIGRTSKGYAVGDKITLADLSLVSIKEYFMMARWDNVPKDLFDSYKNFNTVLSKNMENMKIKECITKLAAS